MSSDDQMDDLLRAAGTRWRAATSDTAAPVDFAAITPPTAVAPRHNRWLVMAAAAVVVAAVAVGATWLGAHHSDHNGSPAGPVVSGPSDQSSTSAGVDSWGGLVGTDWKIFQVNTESPNDNAGYGVTGSSASIRFNPDGSFVANDGVNTLSGPVTITAGQLHFGDVAETGIGTTDPNSGATASKIDAILQGDVAWSIGDAGGANDLSIDHPGVGSLIYFGDKPPANPVTDPAKLLGTWQLTAYEQTDISGGSGSATGPGSMNGFGDLLVITATGFKVQHRCYADAGDVTIEQGRATWSNVHLAGSIPCPATADQKDEQQRNALVDSVLSGQTTWTIDGNGQLRITKGGNTLGYSPYATDSSPTGSPTK